MEKIGIRDKHPGSATLTVEISAHPVSVLEGSDEQVYEPGDGSVLPQRSVIRGTQRQVPNQTDHRLK
jgi:hypothetical protein